MIPRPLFPNHPVLRFLSRYGLALLLTDLAVGVRMRLDPMLGNELPLPVFLLAVAITCWLVGWGPGLLSMLTGLLAMDWFFLPPRHTLFIYDSAFSRVAVTTFVVISGMLLWILSSLRRSRNTNQELVKQLTLEKRALFRSERRYRVLLDQVSELVWTTNPAGQITELAPNCMTFTGLPVAELLGERWVQAVHPEDREPALRIWQEALTNQRPLHNEYRLRRHDGEYRDMLVTGVPVFNEAGQVEEWVGNCRDITECKTYEARLKTDNERLEKLVRERTRKLQEANEDLHQFSYSIAHDMRAPLRAIVGYVHLAEVQGGQVNSDVHEFYRRIKTAAQRMDSFITDSLNYTKVLRAELPLDTVDLDALLPGLIETYPNFQPEYADIELVHPLPKVLGNETALTHAFSNLLTNAIKYVARGQQPHIKVWGEDEHDGFVRVCVQDHGIGIAQEDQQRIWLMFQRLHGDEEYQGTGIGLTIVKKTTTRMGGKVGLQSTPGQGSTFWLDLLPATRAVALAA